MSDCRTDTADIHQHLCDAENAIINLNRQITDAIVSKRATCGLSIELDAAIEARDFMKARLMRLEGSANDN